MNYDGLLQLMTLIHSFPNEVQKSDPKLPSMVPRWTHNSPKLVDVQLALGFVISLTVGSTVRNQAHNTTLYAMGCYTLLSYQGAESDWSELPLGYAQPPQKIELPDFAEDGASRWQEASIFDALRPGQPMTVEVPAQDIGGDSVFHCVCLFVDSQEDGG